MPTPPLDANQLTLAQRRHAVALVVSLTTNTHLAPQRYEQQLLTRFASGELSLNEMEALLEARVYQVLYHSQAASQPTPADLDALLDEARSVNAAHGITGLLLYSEGRFVQLLEGPEAVVSDLYAGIQRDPRHEQVVTVSEGPGPQRLFTDWSMGFGQVAARTSTTCSTPCWPRTHLPACASTTPAYGPCSRPLPARRSYLTTTLPRLQNATVPPRPAEFPL